MPWEVEYTDEFYEWWRTLPISDQASIEAAVDVLIAHGPTLGRPLVDRLRGSRFVNMKELRPGSSTIRILFAFDPTRSAILLTGGDKRGEWGAWYRRTIPLADELYEQHLRELDGEGH